MENLLRQPVWTRSTDTASDEQMFMTPAQRAYYNQLPIATTSIIVGNDNTRAGDDDDDDGDTKQFNGYVARGIRHERQNAIYNSKYRQDHELAEREKHITAELNRVHSTAAKTAVIIKILKHDGCRDIPKIDLMLKNYYKHVKAQKWYNDDDDDDDADADADADEPFNTIGQDDNDDDNKRREQQQQQSQADRENDFNLRFIEDTQIIHPVSKIFQMYDMLTNSKDIDDEEDIAFEDPTYIDRSWSGFSHIFTHNLEKVTSPTTLTKIAVMNHCANHVDDPPLSSGSMFAEFVRISNGIQEFMKIMGPLIKKKVLYTLLFGKDWVPTVELETDRQAIIEFVGQTSVLRRELPELVEFCIVYSRTRDVYTFIHRHRPEMMVHLPQGTRIQPAVSHLLYDETLMARISSKWYRNLTRRRRLIVQTISAKEMKDRLDLKRELEEVQKTEAGKDAAKAIEDYMIDYDQNREERLNAAGGGLITSDVSWTRDAQFQRRKQEDYIKNTTKKLKRLLDMRDSEIMKAHKREVKEEKLTHDQEMERYKLARGIKDKLADIERRTVDRQASEQNRREALALQNESMKYKIEYANALAALREQYHETKKTEKDQAVLAKKTRQIDLDIIKLTKQRSAKDAAINIRQIALDERRMEILNNLTTSTFDQLSERNKHDEKVVTDAIQRYDKLNMEKQLAANKRLMRLLNLGASTDGDDGADGDDTAAAEAARKAPDGAGGGGGEGSSSSNLDEVFNAMEIAKQLKDIRIITKNKANQEYEKVVERVSSSDTNYYNQVTKLTDSVKKFKEANLLSKVGHKIDMHNFRNKLREQLVRTAAAEKANKVVAKEHNEKLKLLTDLQSREQVLLKEQLKYITADMSKKMKRSLDMEEQHELDSLMKDRDHIEKARDRMEKAAYKYADMAKIKDAEGEIASSKEALIHRDRRDTLALMRRFTGDDRREMMAARKDYDKLMANQTKMAERSLNQLMRDMNRLSQGEQTVAKTMREKTKANLKEVEKFKRSTRNVLGIMENFEEMYTAAEEDDDDDDIAEKTSMFTTEMFAQTYEKLENATDMMSELPALYQRHIDTIKEAGIDVTNEENPYENIDKRVQPLLDSSQAMYARKLSDIYTHIQSFFVKIRERIDKLQKSVDIKLGAVDEFDIDLDDDDDDDKRFGASNGGGDDDDGDDDDGGDDDDDDDDDRPGRRAKRRRIEHNLPERTTQEQRVDDILQQTNDICRVFSTECASVNSKNEQLLAELHKLQNKYLMAESKNSTTAKTLKVQHVLIDTKHKEIEKAITNLQSFFKTNMQRLMKITEQASRENKKKIEMLRKNLSKMDKAEAKIPELEHYIQTFGEFSKEQEFTIQSLMSRRDENVVEIKKMYDEAYAAERSHLDDRIQNSERSLGYLQDQFRDHHNLYMDASNDYVEKLVHDINKDFHRAEVNRDLAQKEYKRRSSELQSRLDQCKDDLDSANKLMDNKRATDAAYRDYGRRQREQLLDDLNSHLDDAAIHIMTMNDVIQAGKTLYVSNADLPRSGPDLDAAKEIAEFDEYMRTRAAADADADDGSDGSGSGGGGGGSGGGDGGGKRISRTGNVRTTTTFMPKRGNGDDGDDDDGGDGGDGGGGGGGGGGGTNSLGGIEKLNVYDLPPGAYAKKGGSLLVLNKDDRSAALINSEANKRIKDANKELDSRSKDLDKRETDLATRERTFARNVTNETIAPPALDADAMLRNLNTYQRRVHHNVRMDLLRKIEAQSSLTRAEHGEWRQQTIDEQRELLAKQAQMIQALEETQHDPASSANLDKNAWHNTPLSASVSNVPFSRQHTNQGITKTMHEDQLLSAPGTLPENPVSISEVLDRTGFTALRTDVNRLLDDGEGSSSISSGSGGGGGGGYDDGDAISDTFVSTIANLRAAAYKDILDQVKEQDLRGIEKSYNKRIQDYIRKAKKMKRIEDICQTKAKKDLMKLVRKTATGAGGGDDDNGVVAQLSRQLKSNADDAARHHPPVSQVPRVSSTRFCEEDIIMLEKSTLAHDDTVPQLNHYNIDILNRQLRRKWDLLTNDWFQSISNVNINGVKTGDTVDIIYVLEHLIKPSMTVLTDDCIKFNVVISYAHLSLSEYDLFESLENKKRDELDYYYNNSDDDDDVDDPFRRFLKQYQDQQRRRRQQRKRAVDCAGAATSSSAAAAASSHGTQQQQHQQQQAQQAQQVDAFNVTSFNLNRESAKAGAKYRRVSDTGDTDFVPQPTL